MMPTSPVVAPKTGGSVKKIGLVAGGLALTLVLLMAIGFAAREVQKKKESSNVQPVETLAPPLEGDPSDQPAPEPVAFESLQAFLDDPEPVNGKLVRIKVVITNVRDDEIDFERSDNSLDMRVVCEPSPDEKEKFQDLKDGQSLAIVGRVPAKGAVQILAASPTQSGLYQLTLSECRIP
jgi:hypothetical protein